MGMVTATLGLVLLIGIGAILFSSLGLISLLTGSLAERLPASSDVVAARTLVLASASAPKLSGVVSFWFNDPRQSGARG